MGLRLFLIFEEMSFFMPDYLRRVILRRKPEIVGMTPSNSAKASPKNFQRQDVVSSYAVRHPFRFGIGSLTRLGSMTIYYKTVNILCRIARTNSPYSVRDVAKSFGIPIIDTVSINDKLYLDKLRELQIDIIGCSCGQIFKKEILSLPRLGCLNVHNTTLPSYGGCYAPIYQLLNDEKMSGSSCHTMEERIDGGVIVAQKRFPISENETVFSLYSKGYGIADAVLDEGIDNFVNNRRFPDATDVEPSYYSFPSEKDLDRLFLSGKKFI